MVRIYDRCVTSSVPRPDEGRVLRQVISTVGSSLQLGEVLAAVVRLLSEASVVHACFVYIREDGERLVLRSASAPYSHLVGRIVLERGEGLAWWVVEHRRPSFIRDDALADPRVKYVPELEEERFQSLISVPIIGRGDEVIGVISLHSEAPREFSGEEVEFLVSCSSLVAGAIENARLYEETTRRVAELEELTELGETIARAASLDDLLASVTVGSVRLLRASSCHVYVRADDREEFSLRMSAPADARAKGVVEVGEVASELAEGSRPGRILVPLRGDEELIGLLRVEGSSAISLARTVASQTAVAMKKIELIERLTEKNLIKDFFEQLLGGKRGGNVEERAAQLGFDLSRPYLVLLASPVDDELERAIVRAAPGSLFDRHEDSMRALLWLTGGDGRSVVEAVRRTHRELETPIAIGVSSVCTLAETFPAGFEEAQDALVAATVLRDGPAVVTYDELGPYKYLLRMSGDGGARDPYRDAVARLAEYDERRSTSLLRTLEEFLRRHGSVTATSEALYVHPNTLRQRLRRVGEISGLDLETADWLTLEIAVKLVKLRQALEASPG
jgi:sugar diacid utilization regulator/putative methionine-R-sulfoxide reductase with GAF domain